MNAKIACSDVLLLVQECGCRSLRCKRRKHISITCGLLLHTDKPVSLSFFPPQRRNTRMRA